MTRVGPSISEATDEDYRLGKVRIAGEAITIKRPGRASMTPIREIIPGVNFSPVMVAKDQPEYQTLPCAFVEGAEGRRVSRWKLTWRERIRVLFSGSLWLTLLSFNGPVTPCMIDTECPISIDQVRDYSEKVKRLDNG